MRHVALFALALTLLGLTIVDAATTCKATGCSGQICSSEDVITTCEWTAAYDCYKSAKCEVQADTGKCGWSQSAGLVQCVNNANGISSGIVPPTPEESKPQQLVTNEGDQSGAFAQITIGFLALVLSAILTLA
ncbi:hypothetical protein FGO68_gene11218 [Halteria grandinella]|uniref:Uncharacterized protein n=1 Tax=Halteria grandinella TaxID=5974 RepID=A0A8J8NBC7_HALGN|nr:hypothetical protein FGO68_gene11218 [Halteria grandinella]